MLARARTTAVLGLEAVAVDVEVEVTRTLPRLELVGLPSGAVQEALVRVLAAVRNVGIPLPERRVIINLAPADLRKEGTGFDLPIAMALLAGHELLAPEALEGLQWAGELSLSGEVKAIRGVLPRAIEARRAGARGLVVPEANALEAAVVEGLPVHPARHLGEVIAWMEGAAPAPTRPPAPAAQPEDALDLCDVAGQEHAKRALEVAAAGAHNLLLFGPPGSGKTMLARRLPGILPPLTFEEALEATVVHSVAGLTRDRGLLTERPFRAPHHSVSDAGLVGGGSGSGGPRPGEVSLAHQGVLFLDEVAEFRRHVLDALRQPAEDGEVSLVRAARAVRYPAQFMLVAAMNPCPCGWYGDARRACRCTLHQLELYRRRLSGPLLDRIDLHVDVPALAAAALPHAGAAEPSQAVRARVAAARARQLERARAGGRGAAPSPVNARLRGAALRRICALDAEGRRLLAEAVEKLGLSARAHDRILRVARTIADLEDADRIQPEHLAEAVQYRALDRRT